MRRFFWSWDSNGKGIHNVTWCYLAEGKAEGGIGIKDLSIAKQSLMAKHMFKYLNRFDAIWVDILYLKYGHIYFWTDKVPPNCSWFFRGLCKTTNFIKLFCKINSFNHDYTSFLLDPWCFDIPIAFKPTFINMSAEFELINISDFIMNNFWDNTRLNHLFGDNFNLDPSILSTHGAPSHNHWVWNPKNTYNRISAAVYYHIMHINSNYDHWPDWAKLWKIHVAPRIKHFIWLIFKRILSTSDFLFRLHFGPNNPCIFCKSHRETIEHFFHQYSKAKLGWNQIGRDINQNISFTDGFATGVWLTNNAYSNFATSVIAAGAWFIWKASYDAIFRNISPNFYVIACKSIAHANEFSLEHMHLKGRKLILNNFSSSANQFLFTCATQDHTSISSIGFYQF